MNITLESLCDIIIDGDQDRFSAAVDHIVATKSNLLSKKLRDGNMIAHRLASGVGVKQNPDYLLEILLNKGFNPNAINLHGNSMLYVASVHGRSRAAALLINHKANVDLGNKSGDTPLIAAAQRLDFDMMEILIKGGANISKVNRQGESCESIVIRCVGDDENKFKAWQTIVVSRAITESLDIQNIPPSTRRVRSL